MDIVKEESEEWKRAGKTYNSITGPNPQKKVHKTVHLSQYQIKGLKILVKKGIFDSRAEAIRFAVYNLLIDYKELI